MISLVSLALTPLSLMSALAEATGGAMPAPGAPSIVPKPTHMEVREDSFTLAPQAKILVQDAPEVRQVGEYLAQTLAEACGLKLEVAPAGGSMDKAILLTTEGADAKLGDEGYALEVKAASVTIRALKPVGLFYGVQTIRQLLASSAGQGKDVIPGVKIEDKPLYPWRGMLLDCCRHFMSKDFVKRQIDLLAYHKMNRLHWHLTEDQGWRIEIKKYPRLTEVGSWRKTKEGERYGGFYTQDDVREIVAYARNRYVMVVPEIEMPGHSMAALAAYPELSCTGGPIEVCPELGVVLEDVYCAGNEKTFELLEGVLSEVVELFPGPYVHIGGDECPKTRWKACPKCQERIRTEGLKDEHELQSYFIKRMEKFLNGKGRQIIGWDEILEGGLAPGATVQSWRGIEGAIAAAKMGHDTIVSPTTHCYIDYPIEQTPLEKTYSFNPIPEGLTAEQSRHILGSEVTMWTEWAPEERVDIMTFPRLCALAEVLWTPRPAQARGDFVSRMEVHCDRLKAMGVNVGPGMPELPVVLD